MRMSRNQESKLDDPQVQTVHTGSSRRSRRSLRRQASMQAAVIVETGSKYHPWLVVLLIFPLVAIFIPLYYALRADDYHTAWVLLWSLIFVVFLYMMVLPKTFDVRSDGVVGVKTALMTYKFGDISRAYQSDFSSDELLMPRIKFATSLQTPHRVVLCRKNGRWDVLVSPVDVDYFVETVNDLADDREATTNSSKRDLSIQ